MSETKKFPHWPNSNSPIYRSDSGGIQNTRKRSPKIKRPNRRVIQDFSAPSGGTLDSDTDPDEARNESPAAMKEDLLLQSSKIGFKSSVSVLLTVSCFLLTWQSINILKAYEDWPLTATVWASAWITCATTGLGALPFFVVDTIGDKSVGLSNAIAAGMMFTASFGLVLEGATTGTNEWCLDSSAKVLVGLWSGVGFIKLTEIYFGEFDAAKELGALGKGMDAKRLLLIFAVMTIHSFAEGVGLGVSFQSENLGTYISTTLAIHNVPEGLALSIVLIPRGISKVTTALLCVFSSLPQPIMAVPAFLFVEYFKIILPLGLGFAAGAMLYVAAFELFSEARRVLSTPTTVSVSFLASLVMFLLQVCLKTE